MAGAPAVSSAKRVTSSIQPNHALATPSSAQLLQALSTRIPRVRSAIGYRFGMLAAAIVMLTLPVIYLGLMALVAMGLWWYATHAGAAIFDVGPGRVSGRAGILLLVVYVAPIVAG